MSITIVSAANAPAAVGPYAQAVVCRGIVYCSGQLPLDPATGELVPGDISVQTSRVLENLDAVLRAAGSRLDQVIRTTVYLQDLSDFASMNAVYSERFGAHRPARATVQVAALPRGARVEIDCMGACG